jgi:hypothetical protein
MAVSSSRKIVAEIADAISSKQNLYRAAYDADLTRIRAQHGEAALAEALQLAEQRNVGAGHTAEVRAADRLLRKPQDHRFKAQR